ncbi:MAG: hypothetical protein ACLQUY_27385, partial [Ktedonobacterales bacterium]
MPTRPPQQHPVPAPPTRGDTIGDPASAEFGDDVEVLVDDPDSAGALPERAPRTPSFVCEVPLRVSPQQERVLLARLEAARALYNACLGEALRRYRLVRESRAYQHARHLPRHTPERTEAFRAARAAYAFSDAALQAYAKDGRHQSHWIELHLDAPVTQKLASRAFQAVQRLA